MTIPRRADMASGDPQAAARTRLLAELPHVGEEPAIAPIAPPAKSLKSTHPAFAEYADYDEPALESSHHRATRYVDQAHLDDERGDENVEWHENRRRTNQPLVHRQRQIIHGPKSKSAIGGLLSEAHQQVAPFAGLIVTAALVAAAGLLFHMMAGDKKSNAELDEYALPGFQVEALEESLPSSPSAPLAEISATPEVSEQEASSTEPPDLAPGEGVRQKSPAAGVSAQTAPPLAETNIEPTIPLGQLSFPQTDTPLALDYGKATDPDLQKLPEVAERTEAAATEGINR